MNDSSQIEYHKETVILLNCDINQTEEGYQALCPTCPWTSGIKPVKSDVQKAFYKHLDYIGKGLNG